MNQNKLCICGNSHKFPLCDNSHIEKNWSCKINSQWSHLGFFATYSYQNLAMALASYFKGVSILSGNEVRAVEKLVIILDGTDLESTLRIIKELKTNEIVIFSLGEATSLLKKIIPDSKVISVDSTNILNPFEFIRACLEQNKSTPIPEVNNKLKSAFISHAVKDEKILNPIFEYLRNFYQAELFTCSDSIPAGQNWQEAIYTALAQKDIFLLLLSEHTLNSGFCAFEAGYALGLKKDFYIISLDNSLPPVFIQQIQATNIIRLKEAKPWLNEKAILTNEIIKLLI